jgi:hypothetical protein
VDTVGVIATAPRCDARSRFFRMLPQSFDITVCFQDPSA